MLLSRWRVLNGPMTVEYGRVQAVTHCCMILQNVCVRRQQAAVLVSGRRAEGETEPGPQDEPVRVLTTNAAADNSFAARRGRPGAVAVNRRSEITAALLQGGIKRPLANSYGQERDTRQRT
jgi:hypothetical protein